MPMGCIEVEKALVSCLSALFCNLILLRCSNLLSIYGMTCRDHKKTSRLTSKVLTGYLFRVSVNLYSQRQHDIPQFELLKNGWMQNSKLPNAYRLSIQPQIYPSSMSSKESRLVDLFNPISIRFCGVLTNLVVCTFPL